LPQPQFVVCHSAADAPPSYDRATGDEVPSYLITIDPAQEHCEPEVLVAGSVSPAVTALQRRRIGSAERMDVLAQQVRALTAGRGVDVLILETFGYLDELVEAVSVASGIAAVPMVAQATFADDAYTLGGETPREVATVLSGLPVAMLGTNCTIGPQRMLTVA
jgi:methionine synthase / methylenetetrahydrofolate reductase(NADPH)